jgi:sec-independent protein translocase protein TatA
MEIFLILLIVLLLFGAKRLPELSRSMGKSLREFKKATSDVEEDFRNAMNEEPEKKPGKKNGHSPESVGRETDSAESAESDKEKTVPVGKDGGSA